MAQVSGPVMEIFTEENARVQAGDLLFSIDSKEYQYDKALAESALSGYEAQLERNRIGQVMTTSPGEYLDAIKQELSAAQASYEAAKIVYEADQVLFESGSISRVQMETDKAAYETALSAWQSARGRYEESSRLLSEYEKEGLAQENINRLFYDSEEAMLTSQIEAQKTKVSQLEDKIEKCQVKAEKGGIVTGLPVKDMSVIQAGETAVVLGGSEETFVEADVLTSVAPYLSVGTLARVTFKLRGRDETYEGAVSRIYEYAEQKTSSLGLKEYRVHVEVTLEEPETLKGKEGYGVHVEFLLFGNGDVLTVPQDAVFEAEDEKYVFEIQDGRAQKVPVKVRYETGIYAVIESGLTEGEEVIAKAGEEGIYEGAKVRKQ